MNNIRNTTASKKKFMPGRLAPDEYIRAALSHAWGICTNVQPMHRMENVLYPTDELTGLIAALALVRPSRNLSRFKS